MRLAVFALFAFVAPVAAQPPDLVAPTGALSPADERKAFTVPPGFDVQLIASEPDIQKPMQMAFDAKGRMWVTTSRLYPFPIDPAKGTDKLYILSDFGDDGKARSVKVFADSLDIPIGILPLPDCNSCIVSSVGEIRKLTDTNGDGVADKTEVLFTGFGFDDTHGMTNSFTLMPDGWVYACHGFRNSSTVKGKDGHEVKMQSGNTFRFRPDGSRIEVYTRGQVNPFGMTVDPWFNLYTADCHSKPITQLIPGAYYDSFGKPHDGLGFAAHVTRHDHGSTGLCGLSWYDANQFPKEYLGCMFLGNVVTNRINIDRIEWKGATPVAKELPDFMSSKDRWFRPVDIKLGPDGALYVADFYNKIIGHYEVDLKHPGRDKDRGRIWRIVWKGLKDNAPPPKMAYKDLLSENVTDLLDLLGNPNFMVFFQATNELIRRDKKSVFTELEPLWSKLPKDDRRQGLLFSIADRHGEIIAGDGHWLKPEAGIVEKANGEIIAAQLLKSLAARPNWEDLSREATVIALTAKSPAIQRAAVEVVAFHPHADFVAPLLKVLKACAADDTHLRHAARIALRNCLRDHANAWPDKTLSGESIFSEIALAIPSEKAATFLLASMLEKGLPRDRISAASEHIVRYGDKKVTEKVLAFLAEGEFDANTRDAYLGVFRAVQARGQLLELSETNRILSAMDEQLANKQHFTGKPFDQMTVQHQLGVVRVLSLLPSASSSKLQVKASIVQGLKDLANRPLTPSELRATASDALLKLAPADGLEALRPIFRDANTPPDLRERLLIAFAGSGFPEAQLDARDAIKDAPYRTAIAIATAFASSAAGGEVLLDAVRQGKAPARLLQEKAIIERLRAANIANLDKQLGDLTKGLPPADQRLAGVIKARAAKFPTVKPDKELGAKIFAKNCAACHRIGDMGGKIAPQLDGIGIRGLERVLEDTLDPNRNVDQAFRARVITTKDEKTITGLMLRVEGEVVVIADGEGKEVRIPTKDIDKNRETMLSPMPANVADIIPEAEFYHLVAYLLDQKVKEPPPKK